MCCVTTWTVQKTDLSDVSTKMHFSDIAFELSRFLKHHIPLDAVYFVPLKMSQVYSGA